MTCGMTTKAYGLGNVRAISRVELNRCGHCTWKSLAEEALGLGVQCLPLRNLAVHGAEARDLEHLPRLLHCVNPLLQWACCPSLLGPSRRRLAHNLAGLVLHQLVLRHATAGLLLATTEDNS